MVQVTWLSWIGIGSVFGCLGVALGAFGAHGLKNVLDARELDIFETGVRYQMYHAFAIIVVGVVLSRVDSSLIRYAGWSFVSGIVIFSGSLYTLTLSGQRWLGAITPLGGLALIVGWLLLAYAVFRMN